MGPFQGEFGGTLTVPERARNVIHQRTGQVIQRRPVGRPDKRFKRHAGDQGGAFGQAGQFPVVEPNFSTVIRRAGGIIGKRILRNLCDTAEQFGCGALIKGGKTHADILPDRQYVNVGRGHLCGNDKGAILRDDEQ